MADRNPYIPSERRQDVEGRTQINENEANRQFAEKQAKLQHQAHEIAKRQTTEAENIDDGENADIQK